MICSKNIYTESPNYILVDVKPIGEDFQKLTYRDSHCIIWKVAQIALAVFLTLATLCISLCFLKGRQLLTNALGRFKDHIVFEKIVPSTSSKTDTMPIDQTETTPLQIAFAPPTIQTNNDAELQLKIAEILDDNPDWKITVGEWKDISLADQAWVLQLFELRKLGVRLPPLDSIVPSVNKLGIVDTHNIGIVISKKTEIETSLAQVFELSCVGQNLKKCPDAIGLLLNLKRIDLSVNQLLIPPDVSKNIALKELLLNGNKLTTPPDVTRNTALTILDVMNNFLTTSPDVSYNLALESLYLGGNSCLETPSNVSKNPALTSIAFQSCNLIAAPDVSKNINLNILQLDNNKLTSPPNISNNTKLRFLFLRSNPLSAFYKTQLTSLDSSSLRIYL